MKKRALFTAFMALLLSSCAVIPTTTFTEYRGPAVFEGKGGTVRVADGIDFWTSGEPDKKYKVIGVIDDSRNDKPLFNLLKEGAIAKVAKEHGGDGVIMVATSRQLKGFDANFSTYAGGGQVTGEANYRNATRLIVVKYVQ